MSRMTYMPQFPALQRLHDDTLERLREWLRVHPGDFAARNDSDEAAIRAHNNVWSHQWSPCWSPSHYGSEL